MIISNAENFYVDDNNSIVTRNFAEHMNDERKYNEIRLYNLTPGERFDFNVYAYDADCYKRKVGSKTIILPNYNKYYNDPVCVGKEEYQLCNLWYNNQFTYDQFVEKVSNYKADNATSDIVINEEEDMGLFDIILQFYLNYYYYILPSIIIVLVLIIIYHNKKTKLF